MSRESSIFIQSDGVKIDVKGITEQYSGLDLQVKAITAIIEMIDYKFAEEDDPEIRQKVALQILDSIGSSIKYGMIGFSNKKKKRSSNTRIY
jgi:hypothetical protein